MHQPDILQQLHHDHLGLQKCLHCARVSVYWPNLMEQLKELVTTCRVCLKYSQANRKDSKSIGPPLGQEIPTRPWAKLATDIFTFNNENDLLIVNYMSRFPVIRCLSNMTAKVVAEHMKAIFSELGVPKTLVSHNGPCYTGEQFKKTKSHLGIMYITTSPHHHHSNGLAQSYVKIIKKLLSKAKETGQDYHEVISVYRSTPLSNDLPSPFELLHGRKPSTDLPQWERKSKVNLEVLRQQNKNEQAQHDILPVGSHVMFITPPEKRWHPDNIQEYLGHQSCKVQTPDGVAYHQNRLHLKPYVPQSTQRKVQTKLPELNVHECPQRQQHAHVKVDL